MSAKDLVCAEGELTTAARDIRDYADFLIESIDTYNQILAGVQRSAIQDDLISARLSAISTALVPYKETISEASSSVSEQVSKYIDEIEKADNFTFPSDFTSTIFSILSNFL